MAGKLIYVNKAVADGTSTTLSVTGINSEDLYMVIGYNIFGATNTASIYTRVTKGGVQDSTANYDYAQQIMDVGYAFAYVNNTNQTVVENFSNMSNDPGKFMSCIYYLKNFNSATDYSFFSNASLLPSPRTWYGSGVHKVNSASDGIGIFPNVGNVGSGSTLVLYKVL